MQLTHCMSLVIEIAIDCNVKVIAHEFPNMRIHFMYNVQIDPSSWSVFTCKYTRRSNNKFSSTISMLFY